MTEANTPNYSQLVRFLMEPLLESPESLSVNCELANQGKRVWVRVAFEGEDRGRFFGRGGRNIQAIRTVLEAAAQESAQSIYLDIYGTADSSTGTKRGTKRDRDRDPDSGPSRSKPNRPQKPSRRSAVDSTAAPKPRPSSSSDS
jgi:predicted RNA-binding protein YlqC (UPF0109 family)